MTTFRIAIIALGVAGVWIVSYVFFSNAISSFVADYLPTTDEPALYSHAGDYFNARWGLPIALFGAIVGSIVTFFAGLLAARQGDVQILEFVESKLAPAKENYAALIEQIGRLGAVSNRAFHLSEALIEDIAEIDPEDRLVIGEQLSRLEQSDLAKHVDHLIEAKALCEVHRTVTLEIARIFRVLSLDTYAAAIHAAHLARQQPFERPLPYVAKVMPPAARMQEDDVSENMFALADNLVTYAENTYWWHFIGAYTYTPDVLGTQDFLGHAMRPIILTLNRPISRNGFKITGYTFNLGAAYLLTIIAFLPEADMVRNVFKRIFRDRSGIAMRFLDIAGLDRAMLGSPYIFRNAIKHLEKPERLVLVRLVDRTTEFYDKNRHGQIPQSGYVEDPVGARTHT